MESILLLQQEKKIVFSMLSNPLKTLTKKEWLLWLASLAAVIISNLATNDLDLLTLISALLGVTSLIFAAKGSVWAQFLMIVFCILYGIISFRFHYWGEMITYLGMTLPMAVWSAITWLQNPSEENENEVAIQTLNKKHIIGLIISTIIVTSIFYYPYVAGYTKYYIQYLVYCNKFCCSITYYAAFFILRYGICRKRYRVNCTLGACLT